MAKIQISEINIADHRIRKRNGGNLLPWIKEIDSIIYPNSIKAEVFKNGSWEKCIVSGKVSVENEDLIQMCLYFSDATAISECHLRQYYLSQQDESL